MLTHLTIKDIAKLSGTSVSTVSRVLNNHPDVSEKARAQVMETVEQYRYVPNNSARNLVIRESDTIAVVVRGIANPFFTRIIKTIERAIYSEGYSMSLHQISSSDDELMTAAMVEPIQTRLAHWNGIGFPPWQVTIRAKHTARCGFFWSGDTGGSLR